MSIEISLRRPFSLPSIYFAQQGDSRKDYHWIGQKPTVEPRQGDPGNQNRDRKNNKNDQKYHPLGEITLGEVDDVYNHYKHQLLFGQTGWVGKKYFCQIPLKRNEDGRPRVIFGRVKTCHPSDGYIDNVEEMELYFPRKDRAPDVLHIKSDEIDKSTQKQVQSYFVRVRMLMSEEDQVDLEEADPKLRANGFYPELESSYLDLLEMTSLNQPKYPWMYVISSRWFAAVPESVKPEVEGKLKEMVSWGNQIFNYHPEWLDGDVVTLNRVLRLKYAFTPQLLIEPGNSEELSFIVLKTFEKLFVNSA